MAEPGHIAGWGAAIVVGLYAFNADFKSATNSFLSNFTSGGASPSRLEPFYSCSYDQETLAINTAIAKVKAADTCVSWDKDWRASVAYCEVERATGYIHARGTVYWRDQFLSSYQYSADLNGILSPAGTMVQSEVTSVSADYKSVCAIGAFLDAISKN